MSKLKIFLQCFLNVAENGAWNLTDTRQKVHTVHYADQAGNYSVMTAQLFFARRSLFYNFNFVLPCVLITLLVAVPLYGPMLLPVPAVQDNLYAIGWQPWSLLIAITLGALIMWRSLQRTWLNIIALALLAYAGRLMESDNLWDYLVDPGLLVTIAFLGFTGIWISLQRRLKAI